MSTTTDTRLSRYLEDQNEKPQFEHDCESCVFLGIHRQFSFADGLSYVDYDLYFHSGESTLTSTVIARFGEDEDYFSGIESGMPPLIEAKNRVFRYFEIQNLRP